MNWCWIIPVIVGLITALLGYLLGRSLKQREIDEWQKKYDQERENLQSAHRKISLMEHELSKAQESEIKTTLANKELKGRFDLLQHQWDENRTQIQNLKEANEKLALELKDCREQSKSEKDISAPSDPSDATSITQKSKPEYTAMSSSGPAPDEKNRISFDATEAREVYGQSIRENDLTIVEGIGPQIRDLFLTLGITTWYALSQCSVEKCQEVLNSGGQRFAHHKPHTWPRQAQLAYQGQWKELKRWQDELDGGSTPFTQQ